MRYETVVLLSFTTLNIHAPTAPIAAATGSTTIAATTAAPAAVTTIITTTPLILTIPTTGVITLTLTNTRTSKY